MTLCRSATLALIATLSTGAAAQTETAATRPILGRDLTLANGKPATTFFHQTHDQKHHHDTCKVFHHVRALDGTLLTKGNGGMFQHHKGLFIGWNRTKWRDQRFDFWHMPKQELQVFREFLPHTAMNMTQGAQICAIDWVTPTGEVVISERRGLQISEQREDSYVLHLRNELRAPNGEVRLAGDPQHSGQQIRSPQAFAPADATKVSYVRPANAQSHGNDVWTECAWIAAIQQHGDNNYTILRVESAGNRGDSKWSTRDYGRFGATRTVNVTKTQPLILDQFYVIANGARDHAWCASQAAALRNPKNKK